MGKFIITAPNGQTFEITAPEEATEDQIITYAKTQFETMSEPQEAAPVVNMQQFSNEADPEAQLVQGSIDTSAETPITDSLKRQLGLTARVAVRGASTVPAAMADFASGMAGFVSGRPTQAPSTSLEKLMTSAGVPEAETPLEKAVSAGASALSSTASGIKLFSPLGKAAAPIIAAPEVQLPVAAVSGITAEPISTAVLETTENPLLATIAGIATGMVAGGATSKGISARKGIKTTPITMGEIKQRAQRSYTVMEDQGITVKPLSALKIVSTIRKSLDEEGMVPGDPSSLQIENLLTQYEKMIGTQRVDFTTIEKMRRLANQKTGSKDSDIRRLSKAIVTTFDDELSALSPKDIMAGKEGLDVAVNSLQKARKDWRSMSKAGVLEDVLNIAEGKALDPSASEGDLIRKGLIRLITNKNQMRVFTQEEQNAIKAAAKGSSADPLLTLVAKFNPQRSKYVMGGTLAGGYYNPLIASGIAGGGYLADKLQGSLKKATTRGLMSDIINQNVQTPPPSYGWRGALSGLPLQQ